MNKDAIHTKIRVTLINGESERFYGPGVQDLLFWIRKEGSVKDACEAMGLSYTKGRRILKHAEAVLGCSLVTRKQGGRTGGSSTLTPEAEQFMARYEKLADSVSAYAQKQLEELFIDS